MSRLARWRQEVRRLRTSQVRVRVTAAAALVATVAGVLGSVVFVALLNHSLEQALMTSARQQVQAVAAQMRNGSTPQQAVVSGQDDVVTQVVGSDGSLVAGDRASMTKPLRTTPGSSDSVAVPHAPDTYAVVSTRTADGDLIVVGRSEEHVLRADTTATALLVAGVPLGVLLITIVVWVSVGRALRPVEAMRRQASEITSEHLHHRLPVPGGTDEIALLASTLNEMLDRIDSAQKLQRQFIADASHELRSPLASMRQAMEVAEHYPESMNTQELAADVLVEEHRMEELVTALLMLARLDDNATRSASRVVDLDDLVFDEVSRLKRAGVEVKVDATRVDAAQVRGNDVLLAQVVRNLLSNAVRHGVTRIGVSLVEDGGSVRLVVEDDGNGIAPEQRELVFERFVRLDEARNRDEGGSGLGLAIVRKVVAGAGGHVDVDDSSLGGARFSVVLPAL